MQEETKTKKLNAAYLISSAVIGEDFKVILVAGKRYMIKPPTIRKLAGAARYLSQLTDETQVAKIATDAELMTAPARALSWLIDGSEKLAGALNKGTVKEVADGIEAAYKLLSVEDFSKLSALAKSVSQLTANTRQ